MKWMPLSKSYQLICTALFLSLMAANGRAEQTTDGAAQPTQAAAAPAAAAPAQPQAPAAPPANTRVRTMAVLPATDTSSFNLGPSLQGAMVSLLQQTQVFTVQPVSYALPGFSEPDIARAFQTVNTELISQVYLEGERISIFMFDVTRPKEFIVSSQTLADPMLGNQITPQVVEYKLRMAFNDALTLYYKGEFQPLPGVRTDPSLTAKAPDDPKERAAEARRLFRELAALETSKYYLGADMGMARFAGGPASASNVNFGAFGGMNYSPRIKFEGGFDFFSYALFHIDAKYDVPLTNKYLFIDLSFGLARVLGTVFGPRFPFEASLKSGTTAFGPGISFNVPLLGASVRGELKFYVGGGSIFMGSYGISYSI